MNNLDHLKAQKLHLENLLHLAKGDPLVGKQIRSRLESIEKAIDESAKSDQTQLIGDVKI